MRPQVCSVLVCQCPGICTICHSWQHTGVVHLSLQADGKVAFEDIPVFGVCRPACHDSSLYLFVLVLFLEAIVLSQVHVSLDIFYQHIIHVYRGVVYNHHICLCDVHRRIRLLSSDSSCSICCSSCGVSVHMNMSSAKRILERNIYNHITSYLVNQCDWLETNQLGQVNLTKILVDMCLTNKLVK